MSDQKKPVEFQITDHGFDHEQYFPGHGLSFTGFKSCATGCSDGASEALNDALEMLAQDGWDVSEIEASDEAKKLKQDTTTATDWCDCAANADAEGELDFECPHRRYVSVDVR